MIDLLARLLGYVMQGCLWLVNNNYVLALLLFALAMQILMCPLGIKQQKNMVKQAYLRPKEMAIKKKYAGRHDNVTMQKMRNEIMQLQQEAGYSPMAGCLPMLIQLIIIFPIYRVTIRPLEFIVKLSSETCNNILAKANEIITAGGGTAINEKSASAQVQLSAWLNNSENVAKLPQDMQATVNGLDFIPNVSLFGADLGVTPFDAFAANSWWLFLIPFINLGLTYFAQYLTKRFQYKGVLQENGADPMASMKIMMFALPLLTLGITFGFAAAIGIYWIFRTILSTIQQYILFKTMPYPTFTEEDYRNAEKELRGKKVSKAPAGYVYSDRPIRSLHHIDDDE